MIAFSCGGESERCMVRLLALASPELDILAIVLSFGQCVVPVRCGSSMADGCPKYPGNTDVDASW